MSAPTTPKLVGPDMSDGGSAVYLLKLIDMPFVKIGRAYDWQARCCEHQCGCPFPMEVIMLLPGGGKSERDAHAAFALSAYRAEWFNYDANFQAVLKLIELAAGDAAAVLKAQRTELRERVHFWSTLSSLAYDISDLAAALASPPVRNRRRGSYSSAGVAA